METDDRHERILHRHWKLHVMLWQVRRGLISGRGALDAAAGPSLDAATTAWVSAVVAAGGTVSGTQQGYVDTLIKAYKAAGVWTKLDHEWLYASENATQASIDIVGLAVHTLAITPTFTANRGYTGTGSGGLDYIDLGLAPSAGANYGLNTASFGCYIRNSRTVGDSTIVMGTQSGDYSFFRPKNNSGNLEHDINSGAFNAPANADARGNYTLVRTNSSTITPYKNGTAGSSETATASARPTQNWYVLALNNNGTSVSHSSDEVASCFIGGAFTGTEVAAKDLALNAGYMASVGASVY